MEVKNAVATFVLGSAGHLIVWIGYGNIGDVVIILCGMIGLLFYLNPIDGDRSWQQCASVAIGCLGSIVLNFLLLGTCQLGYSFFQLVLIGVALDKMRGQVASSNK